MYLPTHVVLVVLSVVYIKAMPSERLLLRERRIVAGAPATLKDWPYIAYLHFLQPKPKFKVCSAVIVDKYYALTTAHCVYAVRDTPQFLTVGVGSTRRLTGYNPSYNKTVSKIIIYKRYPYILDKMNNASRMNTLHQFRGKFDYDIAMIRFQTPLNIGNGIKPISIVKPHQDLSSSDFIGKCEIAGWGAEKGFSGLAELLLQNYTPPINLKSFSLPIVTNQVCKASYRTSKVGFISYKDITDRIICAGDVPFGTGSGCLGDSGSPLVCTDKSNRKVLCGLLVSGDPSCKPGIQYMMLTRVSNYATWIYDVIHKSPSQL